MNKKSSALVLGATGGIGGETAVQLQKAGWHVRILTRSKSRNRIPAQGYDCLFGDAMKQEDVVNAAKGCSVIIHAVNPPGYQNWDTQVIPMLQNTIAAARSSQATIVLPGTIYNYGPDSFPLLDENSQQKPISRKGAIRVQMEQLLKEYAEQGGSVLIVRAGDFFGANAKNNWFSQGFVKPGHPVKSIANPSTPGIGHQWAYLPDAARTIVQLLEYRADLSPFETFHMAGHWDSNGHKMAQTIQDVIQVKTNRTPKIKSFPWWALSLISPFHKTSKEIMEVRYLWKTPIQMNNQKLVSFLGKEPNTPLTLAVEETLQGLGCL